MSSFRKLYLLVATTAAAAPALTPAAGAGEAGSPALRCNVDDFNVTIGIEFYSILRLNNKNEVLTSKQMFAMQWTDETLIATTGAGNSNASNFYYRKPEEIDCVPYVIVEESVDDLQLPPKDYLLAINAETGQVTMMHQFTYNGYCKINVTYFPFDVQFCAMTIYSEAQDPHIVPYGVTQDYYYENSEFGLRGITVKLDTWDSALLASFQAAAHRRPSKQILTVTYMVRRKPLFYIMTLILPSTMVVLVALIGLFLAAGSAPCRVAKAQLGVMAMLAMGIQMLTTSGQDPVNSDMVPPLTIYYCCLVFITAVAIVTSVALVHVHHVSAIRARDRLPTWICVTCKYLGFLVGKPNSKGKSKQKEKWARPSKKNQVFSLTLGRGGPCLQETEQTQPDNVEGQEENTTAPNPSENVPKKGQNRAEAETARAVEASERTGESKQAGADEAKKLEWLDMMETLDRLFLTLFFLLTTANALWFLRLGLLEPDTLDTSY